MAYNHGPLSMNSVLLYGRVCSIILGYLAFQVDLLIKP